MNHLPTLTFQIKARAMIGQEEGGGAERFWRRTKGWMGKGEEQWRIDGKDGEKLVAWRNPKLYRIR